MSEASGKRPLLVTGFVVLLVVALAIMVLVGVVL